MRIVLKTRVFALFFLILACFILVIAGCWSRHELNTLAIVSGVGIDQSEADQEQVRVTVQIIKPGGLSTPSGRGGGGVGGGGGGNAYLNFSNTAETTFDAIREFTHVVNRKLYFSHSKVLVISQEIAEKGVRRHLDLFFRDQEPRLTSWVVVVKGKAEEVFTTKAEIEQIPAMNIAQMIDAQGATSEIGVANINDFMCRLMCKCTAPIATLLEVKESGTEKIAELTGTAVFKRDKMVGFFDKAESRGLLWVLGEVKSGIIIVPDPKGEGKVSLEIIQAKGKIVPEGKNGSPEITIKISAEGNLGAQMSEQDLTETAAWKSLEKGMARAIENEVNASVKKAQKLKADVFEFGDMMHKKQPFLWKELEPQWEEIFPELKVNVMVEAKLRGSGLIRKPASPEAGYNDAT